MFYSCRTDIRTYFIVSFPILILQLLHWSAYVYKIQFSEILFRHSIARERAEKGFDFFLSKQIFECQLEDGMTQFQIKVYHIT